MKALFERAARALGACLLLLGLSACGPGTGGTGTGPDQGIFSFASRSNVGAATLPGDVATLTLRPQQVEFAAGCRRFVHDGGWSLAAAGQVVVAGTVETRTAAGTVSAPATLRLQFDSADPGAAGKVTATLVDASGATLAGPFELPRGEAAAGAGPVCQP